MLLIQANELIQLLAPLLTKDNISYFFLLAGIAAFVWYHFKYQLPNLRNSNSDKDDTITGLVINEIKNSRAVTVETLATLKELSTSIHKLNESIQMSQHENSLLTSNVIDKLNTITTLVLSANSKSGNGVEKR